MNYYQQLCVILYFENIQSMKHFTTPYLFSIIAFLLFLIKPNFISAHTTFQNKYSQIIINEINEISFNQNKRPNPLQHIFRKNKNHNKKITAAIFAFPFPFGIVGLHRIYLVCAPHIPVVYIASLGGAFGILPLIDFFVLLKEEDISKFNNSDKVFMWVE